MTVSYQYEVASSTSGGFTRLLFMWRGSLYKLIYRELFMFLVMFGTISGLYRHLLSSEHKRSFEQIVVYCDTFINLIPLSFVLGFYVAYVASRWWQQYTAIPWPDKVMHSVALYIIGEDEYGRMVRRALMRYLNLSLILVLRSISSAVKRRFPTFDHVVDAGFMTSLELELFLSVPSLEFNTYWIPCTWFINLLKEARSNNRLLDSQGLKIIMEEFNEFRSKCGMLWSYDWVSIPLVYTQVVTLATYSFFAVALVGRQYIEGVIKPFQMRIDIYFPVFTVLQFFFFMGLLKVAEQLINPFGDDDEDFELNWLIDRHTKVSYLGVDTLMNRCPPLVKDIYYDSENIILPYTEAAASYKRQTYRGSVANMTVPEEKQTMFLPNIIEEEEIQTSSATPRNSSANLAALNDSPLSSNRRQGGSSPSAARRQLARSSGETVVALDMSVVGDQPSPTATTDPSPQPQQQQQQQQANNGRLADAVKMLSGRSRTTESFSSRRPFLAVAKSNKVNIQPWPSATNLQAERPDSMVLGLAACVATGPAVVSTPVAGSWTCGEDVVEERLAESGEAGPRRLPSIRVRRTSSDEAAVEDAEVQSYTLSSVVRPIAAKFTRSISTDESCTSRDAQTATTSGSTTGPKRSRVARFHSLPRFLARRRRRRITDPRSTALQIASIPPRVSTSSPELRLREPVDEPDDQRTKC